MLFLFFEMLTLFFLARYRANRRKLDRWGYVLSLTAVMLTHYCGWILFAGLVASWWIMERSKPQGEGWTKKIIRLHLLPGLSLIVLGVIHILPVWFLSSLQKYLAASYLKPYWIDSPGALLAAPWKVSGFLLGLSAVWVVLPFAFWGLCVLYRDGKHGLLALLLATITGAVVLAVTEQYPLGNSRHAVYLLPLLGLSVAAGIQDWLSRGWRWVTAGAGLLVVLCVLLPMTGWPSPNQRRAVYSYTEQLTTRMELERNIVNGLTEVGHQQAVILMDKQTYYVLIPYFEGAHLNQQWINGRRDFSFEWRRATVVVRRRFAWENERNSSSAYDSLLDFRRRLVSMGIIDGRDSPHVWAVQAGWGSSLLGSLSKTSGGSGIIPEDRPVQARVVRHAELFRIQGPPYQDPVSEISSAD
jgi:hypothetical protein